MIQPKLLPEWSPVRAVVLVWPYPHGDWQANYAQVQQCYFDILAAIAPRCPVWLIYHPQLDDEPLKVFLENQRIAVDRVKFIRVLYDDTWVRDFGPLSLSGEYMSFQFNGWGGKYPSNHDNNIPSSLTQLLGTDVRESRLVCEGGALETNGHVLLLNSNCIVDPLRNPGLNRTDLEVRFQSELGIDKFAWLEGICLTGDDTDGHIDTIARFANEETVVISGRNTEHPDSEVLNDLHRQVAYLATRHQWQLFELPSPVYHSLIDGRQLPCTYANFLICNQWVFVPVYGLREDQLALDLLSDVFADKEIVPVQCAALLEQHGSLHCATMQIADLSK